MIKRLLAYILAFSAAVTTLPAIPVCLAWEKDENGCESSVSETSEESDVPENTDATEHEKTTSASEKPKNKVADEEFYRVLDVASGKVLDVPVTEYITGAVCAEMPASFEEEALKAQAVAAHTYAERQKMRELENPTEELCGAYFSNDTNKYQGYYTENQAKQVYGDNYEEYYGKISEAVNEVSDYILTYENEPIISAFHSMSSGQTESAENTWGAPVDYLVSVDSSSDTDAPKYREEVSYKKDELKKKLEKAFPGAKLGEDCKKWITIGEISDSGTVLTADVGGIEATGGEIRTALALRSPCFDIGFEGDNVIFTTRGYGHGVGMSQYGADAMAEDGSTWREILEHYYPGCSITEIG